MYFTGTFLFYLTQRYKVGKATPILFGEVTVAYKVLVEKKFTPLPCFIQVKFYMFPLKQDIFITILLSGLRTKVPLKIFCTLIISKQLSNL